MKNIERFNLYTAHIFGVLYNEFPVPRMLHGREVVTALRSSLEMSTEEEAKQTQVCGVHPTVVAGDRVYKSLRH